MLAKVQLDNILAQYSRSYPITKNPTVFSILHSISSTVSTLGLDLYQRTKSGSYKAFSHPTALLLEHPNNEDSPTQFLYLMTNHYLSCGNVYILNRGNVLLQLLDPRKMQVTRSNIAPYSKIFTYNGQVFTDAEIIHIYNPQYYDNFIGHSPLEYNSDIIELLNALLLYIGTYFGNSAGERLIVTLDKDTVSGLKSESVKKEFEKWLQEKMLGALAAGKPALAMPGMKLENIKQTTNVESELSSLIERLEKEVAKLFGFPFYKLTGDYGNNLQYQQVNYYQSCILPITEVFKEKLDLLIPSKDRAYMYFDFGYENLLLPDIETKHRIIREDIRGGVVTINEGRKQLNYDLYPGDSENVGDLLWIQSNLIPVRDKYSDMYFANAQKTLQEQVVTENSNPVQK